MVEERLRNINQVQGFTMTKVQKWKIGNKLILTNIQQNPGETNNCTWLEKLEY